MIPLTRLDGTPMIVNCEQIAWIECMPDTVVSLANGEKLLVRETPEAVVERVYEYKRAVGGARRRSPARLLDLSLGGDRGERQ